MRTGNVTGVYVTSCAATGHRSEVGKLDVVSRNIGAHGGDSQNIGLAPITIMPETKASRTTKTKAQHAEGEKKRPKLGAGKSSLKLGESPPPSRRGSTPRRGRRPGLVAEAKKEVTVEAERSSSPTVERPPSPLITVEEEAAPSAAPAAEPSSEDASAAVLTAVREELRKAEERHASELAELRRQLAEASVVPPVQVRLNLGAALLTEPEVAKVAAVAAQAAVAASRIRVPSRLEHRRRPTSRRRSLRDCETSWQSAMNTSTSSRSASPIRSMR